MKKKTHQDKNIFEKTNGERQEKFPKQIKMKTRSGSRSQTL